MTTITRKFETKKRGRIIESEVRLTYSETSRDEFLKGAEGTRWLETVGEESVVSVRKVSVHWKHWITNVYVPGQDVAYFEVTTKTGTACFLTPDDDPRGFIAGKKMMVAGIYVDRDWKGRRGHVMPWLRAQENPSGRKSTIPTDSTKTVPSVCMASIYNAMNPEVCKGYARYA